MREPARHPSARREGRSPGGQQALCLGLLALLLAVAPPATAGETGLQVDVLRAESYGAILDVMLRVRLPGEAGELGPEDFAVFVAPADVPAERAASPRFRIRRLFLKRLGDAIYIDLRQVPQGVGATACQLVLQVGRGDQPLAVRRLPRFLEPPAEELDVALLIDESLSMRRTDPEKLRLEAAKTFVDLASRSTRIARIAIVGFDDTARTLLPLTPPSQADELYEAIERIRALGQTDIDGALELAGKLLAPSPAAAKAVVLLTDGKDEPGRYEEAHRAFARSRWHVYTVGLSERADADVLQRIAADTGGEYHQAPTNAELQDIFGKICLALQKKVLIRSRTYTLRPGAPVDDSIQVDDTISALTISLKGQHPDIAFSLHDPRGRTLAPQSVRGQRGVSYARRAGYQHYDLWALRPGEWVARLRSPRAAEATVAATAVTPLLLRAFPLPASLYRGEPLELAASLAVADSPLADARVSAQVTTADGRTATVPLHDDGSHHDTGTGDGVFAGLFPGSDQPGPCTVRLVATGTTPGGHRFERELRLATEVAAEGHSKVWCSARGLDLGVLYNGEETSRRFDLKLTSAIARAGAETLRVELEPPAASAGPSLPAEALQLQPRPMRLDAGQLTQASLTVAIPAEQPPGRYRGQVVLVGQYDRASLPIELEVRQPRVALDARRLDLGGLESGSRAKASFAARLEPRGSLPARLSVSDHRIAVEPARAQLGPEATTVRVSLAAPPDMATTTLRATVAIETPVGRTEVPLTARVVRPAVQVGPEALDFGEVRPGESAQRKLGVKLHGLKSRVATLAAKPLAGPEGAPPLALSAAEKLELTPGEDAAVPLALRVPPVQPPGLYRGQVTVDTPLGAHTVPCTARVPAIETFAVTDELDFGEVALGETREQPVELTSLLDAEQEVAVVPPETGLGWRLAPERTTVVLPPRGSVRLGLRLTAGEDAEPGPRRARVAFRGPSRQAGLRLRARLVRPPHQTIAFLPATVDVGRLPLGTTREIPVRARSLIDAPQDVSIEVLRAPEGLTVHLEPRRWSLDAGAERELLLTLRAAEGAPPRDFQATVVARGRSEPTSLHIRGDLFPLPRRTFVLRPAGLDLGTVAQGTRRPLEVDAESLYPLDQKLSFAQAPSRRGVSLELERGGFVLPPYVAQPLPASVVVEPDASPGERTLSLEVRGPGEPASLTVQVEVVERPPEVAAPAGEAQPPTGVASREGEALGWGEGLTIFLLLLALVAVLVALYLLARWLLRHQRIPRMAKYFALSGLLHAALLFTALDLFVAHKVHKKELGPLFKVGLKAVGGAPATQERSVADAVRARRELAPRIEAERQKREAARRDKERREAKKQDLRPTEAELERPKPEQDIELTEPEPQTKKLSSQEIDRILEELREAERVREAPQPDQQRPAETQPERVERLRAMSREQLEAAVKEALRPKTAEAERPQAPSHVPDLSAPERTEKATVELDTAIPDIEELKAQAAEAEAADAEGSDLASQQVEARKETRRPALHRATGPGTPAARAAPRPSAAAPRAEARRAAPPTPPATAASRPAERRTAAPAIETPRDVPSLAGQPAPEPAGPATERAEAAPAALAPSRRQGGPSPSAARRSRAPAAPSTLGQARASAAARSTAAPPSPAPSLASAERAPTRRRAAPVALDAPDDAPAADALVQLPEAPAKAKTEAEPIPVPVRPHAAGGSRAPARRTTGPAAAPEAPEARPGSTARREAPRSRTAPAAPLASAEARESQRRLARVDVEAPPDQPTSEAPAAQAELASVASRTARPAPLALRRQSPAGAAGRAARATPRATGRDAAGGAPASRAAPLERARRPAPRAAPEPGPTQQKAAASPEEMVLVEGPLVATRHRETEGTEETPGPRAVVARWRLRRRSRGRGRLAMAETSSGRLSPRGSTLDRGPQAGLERDIESATVERRAARVTPAPPREQPLVGPRAAEGRQAGEAAAAVEVARAAAGPQVERGAPAAAAKAAQPLQTRRETPAARSVRGDRPVELAAARAERRAVPPAMTDVPAEDIESAPRVAAAREGEGLRGQDVGPSPAPSRRPQPQERPESEPVRRPLQARDEAAQRQVSRRSSLLMLPGIEREGRGAGALVGTGGSGAERIVLTTAQYGSGNADWDTHQTMMDFLAWQLRERVGFNVETAIKVAKLESPDILRSPWIYISGHRDFRLTEAQVRNLRRYLLAGGTLWADDSTHEGDHTWDRAFRREIARVLPPDQGYELRRITQGDDHRLFRSCFDLREGYKGYFPPPGDKYRQNYIEGIEIEGRLAVIYTRNDYGDGLEIKPDTFPLKASLSGLSPAEMQESSFLMAANIIVYVLTRGQAEQAAIARAAESLRRHRQAAAARRDPFADAPATLFDDFSRPEWLSAEDWEGTGQCRLNYVRPADPEAPGRRLVTRFRLQGDEEKAVLLRELPEERDLSTQDRCTIDLESRLDGGARLSIALITMPDWKYYESRPVFIRPGHNRAAFDLRTATWKTGEPVPEGQSEYCRPVEDLDAVRRFVILLYPIQREGTVVLDRIRFLRKP
ncbi:MAG: DUF4159 domain-containing protein [Candidatus Brocadiia bacterium]